MGMVKKLLASAVAAWSIGAVAGELYVDDDADAAVVADGSLEKPFKTIQDAVNKAGANDVIYVAEGVYREGETKCENNSYSRVHINSKPGLRIVGAGRGKSVITGSRSPGAGGFVTKDKYVRCIYVKDSEGVIVEGFTLRDGEADKDNVSGQYGGGLLVGGETLEVYLVDCEIVHCSARLGGGTQGSTSTSWPAVCTAITPTIPCSAAMTNPS